MNAITQKETDLSCKFSPDGRWFIETVDGEERRFVVKDVIYSGRTAFQSVTILQTEEYGRFVVLDGETQSAEDDEYIYHEALVQPVMLAHPAPRRVLVIGGGEGATLREVLRHPAVERAVMVDIDGEFVDLARRHLQDWHRGAFDDPRVRLEIRDGLEYLRKCRDKFDVAIVDVCDYVEDTAVAGLYQPAFFSAVRDVLAPDGLAVVQAGELGRWAHGGHAEIARMMKPSFGTGIPYSTFVESFWSEWSFLLAGDRAQAWRRAAPSAVDAAIAARGLTGRLSFYDGQTHQRMFSLPKDIRDALVQDA